MKFLLDMGMAQSTARFLESMGYDALHLRDQKLQRLADELIIEKAIIEGRIILTHDLDFRRIVALSGATTPSVITFRLSNMKADQVNRRLVEVLERFKDIGRRSADQHDRRFHPSSPLACQVKEVFGRN